MAKALEQKSNSTTQEGIMKWWLRGTLEGRSNDGLIEMLMYEIDEVLEDPLVIAQAQSWIKREQTDRGPQPRRPDP